MVRQLRQVQPAMGPLRAWSRELAREVGKTRTGGRLAPTALRWIRKKRTRLLAEPRRLGEVVRHELPPALTLLTFSRSESVLDALRRLPGPRAPRRVLAAESLPGGEGRKVVRELARAPIPARLVRDRDLPTALREADLVMVGADAVEADGSLVHKVGTRRLAELARDAGVPLVVVAGRTKWVGREGGRPRLPRLFDRTPPSLVSAYWTDDGVLPGGRRRGGPRGRAQSPGRSSRGERDRSMTEKGVARVGAEAFDGSSLKFPGIVVVGYLADWCPFCARFAPELEALRREGLTVLRADLTDEESPLWERFSIEIVPSVLLFRDGKEAFRADGIAGRGLSEGDLRAIRTEAKRLGQNPASGGSGNPPRSSR